MSTLIGTSKEVRNTPFQIRIQASLTGLCIRVRLLRSLPERYKVDIVVEPGSHQSENAGTFPLKTYAYIQDLK